MDNQTQEWIRSARSAGMSDNKMSMQLQKNGWSPEQIRSVLYGVDPPPPPMGSSGMPVVSKRHKKMGVLFIILPFAVLLFVLMVWSVMIFVLGESVKSVAEPSTTVKLVQWLLGFVGMIAVISIFILVPVGIYFLNKKTILDYGSTDSRSGRGVQSVVPAEISGWNWGAALLTWIWGIGNNVWISLLVFVPLFNIVWWIILGVHGNEWAWKARAWESVEKFKETQRAWSKWALIIVGCYIGIMMGATLIAVFNK